jgi:hypothetical protein
MKKLARSPAVAKILRVLGIDPVQYSLLLELFGKLSDRQEFELGNARLSSRVTVGIFALISALINLIVAFGFGPKPPVRLFIFGNFVFTTFLLLLILIVEAINTFFNPVDASLLSHLPVQERPYFAAKLTYLAIVVGYITLPVSIVPALAGLNLTDASWFHPMTYVVATYLMGLFIALLACGALGILFRVLPTARVRNVTLWAQIGFFLLIGGGPRAFVIFRGVRGNFNFAASPSLPLNWFVALAAPFNGGLRALLAWSALLSMAGCAIFIAFGIQSLSHGYLTRVHLLLRSGPSRRRIHKGWLGSAVRSITGKPSGRAAFAFVYGMARTDWQFRRTVYPVLIQVLLLPFLGFVRTGLGHTPFIPGRPTAAQILPHIGGFIGLMFCFAITSTNQHKAAWIFLTIPTDGIRSFVRGIFWAIWLPINALCLVVAPILMWRWGIVDGALFTVYSLALGSFYLSVESFLIDGLPFANPPESMKASMAAPLVFAGILTALIIIGLQWFFIFQSKLVTAAAVLVFGAAAYVIGRTSVRYVETNAVHNLHRIGAGRTAMFKEVQI